MDTLGIQAPPYLRNVLEADTMAYTYVYLCQDSCDQLAITRSADPDINPEDCDEIQSAGIDLLPNPTHNLLQIRFLGRWKEERKLEVRDITGRLWLSRTTLVPTDIMEEVLVSSLPEGLYFLYIRDVSGQSAVSSFLKM